MATGKRPDAKVGLPGNEIVLDNHRALHHLVQNAEADEYLAHHQARMVRRIGTLQPDRFGGRQRGAEFVPCRNIRLGAPEPKKCPQSFRLPVTEPGSRMSNSWRVAYGIIRQRNKIAHAYYGSA